MGPVRRMIGVREFKARASAVLSEVQQSGAEFVITLRGRPIARLKPMAAEQPEAPVDGMGGLRGALSELPALTWEDFAGAKKLWEPRPLDDE